MSRRSQARARADSHACFLLQRIAEEAQRAAELDDPLEQARVVATLLQPYSGWALREAVLDCRDAGAQWSKIAPEVGLSQAVLARQVRGAGPVVTIAPSYSLMTDNSGTQTPLRLAATVLVQRMAVLAATVPDSPTVKHLYITVMALAQALGAVRQEPLLTMVEEVLRVTGAVERAHHDLAAAGRTGAERETWGAVDELRLVYGRGQGAVRVAADAHAGSGREG